MTILNKVSNKTLMPGITAIPDVPDAPTIGTATAGNATASITFTSAATGGTVTTFTATSTPGSITGTSSTSPITVSGLTNGTAYTFKVKGTNATATGAESAASNSATPVDPAAYYSLATAVVTSGGANSITFSSIPQTYSHLYLSMTTRDSYSNAAYTVWGNFLTFNGVTTGSKYAYNFSRGYRTNLIQNSAAATSDTVSVGGEVVNSANAGLFGNGFVEIAEYASSTKVKNFIAYGGGASNNPSVDQSVVIATATFNDTTPISSITITCSNVPYIAGTQFNLWGIA